MSVAEEGALASGYSTPWLWELSLLCSAIRAIISTVCARDKISRNHRGLIGHADVVSPSLNPENMWTLLGDLDNSICPLDIRIVCESACERAKRLKQAL